MLHKHRQTCLSATDSRAVDYSPFLYHWFLKLIFSLELEDTTSRSHMCTAANVYVNTTYKPAFCPFLFCTRNLGQIQQRAKCAK